MKYLSFLIFSILFCSLLSAQDLTLIYELRYKSNPLKEEFRNENYFLDIKNNKSIFRSEKNRRSDSLKAKTGYGLSISVNYNNQFGVKKDYNKNKVDKIIIAPHFGNVYLLKPDNLEWLITKEKMKIGEFDCQKAEVNYGGRKWTAWFTTAIPISDGPYIFNQLPGIIIKIFDEDVEFTFDLVKVQKNNWPEFYEHKNTKEINWETFKKLQETYYEQPLLEVRLQNLPISRSDDDANTDRSTSQYMRLIEEDIRKSIRDSYNPLELNHKVNYK